MDLTKNKIGIYEKAIPNAFSWEQKVEAAKQAGFAFIEISVDESDERLARLEWSKQERADLRELVESNGLSLESMCLSGHRRFPFGSADEETRNKAYEIMDQAIELALDLGVRNIQLAGYDVYYEESNDATLARFLDGLNYAAKQAEKAGVMLTIEIMDTWLIGTITRGLVYVNTVNSPFLKLYPDLGNLTQWCDDPRVELRKGIDVIEAIHLKDTQPGKFKCVPFGDGTVKFPELFDTLKELKYQKPFLIEMWADNDSEYTMERCVKEISDAKAWLYDRM